MVSLPTRVVKEVSRRNHVHKKNQRNVRTTPPNTGYCVVFPGDRVKKKTAEHLIISVTTPPNTGYCVVFPGGRREEEDRPSSHYHTVTTTPNTGYCVVFPGDRVKKKNIHESVPGSPALFGLD